MQNRFSHYRGAPLLTVGLAFALMPGGCGSFVPHHAEEEAVLAKVQDFFDAMQDRDVELAQRTMLPEAGFMSVRQRDGARALRHSTNAAFIEGLADRTVEVREWLDGPTVLIEGDVAMVWSPYFFEREGELSHTGIDAICLIRTDEGWKMAGGVYSVVPVEGD